MAGVRHDLVTRLRPRPGEFVRGHGRADHVVAALDDHGGKMTDTVQPVEQLVLAQEHLVGEVMRPDARQGETGPLPSPSGNRARLPPGRPGALVAAPRDCRTAVPSPAQTDTTGGGGPERAVPL